VGRADRTPHRPGSTARTLIPASPGEIARKCLQRPAESKAAFGLLFVVAGVVAQERSTPRTVHALGAERPVDFFALRRKHAWLAPMFDAEYGSGTFVVADREKSLELRVSTTGLLLRSVSSARLEVPSNGFAAEVVR
jgi:hypothetical protein